MNMATFTFSIKLKEFGIRVMSSLSLLKRSNADKITITCQTLQSKKFNYCMLLEWLELSLMLTQVLTEPPLDSQTRHIGSLTTCLDQLNWDTKSFVWV